MGHREDLLAAARKCLYRLGYAGTTARDLVAESGTNLASIGYHFGSKDALLDLAMVEAIGDWGGELETAALAIDSAASPQARMKAIWTAIIASFERHRPLWVATVEALARSERAPEVRARLADALERGREGLLAAFEGPGASRDRIRSAGSIHQALLTGIGVQWLVDPARAPTAAQVVAALTGGLAAPAERTGERARRTRPARRPSRQR